MYRRMTMQCRNSALNHHSQSKPKVDELKFSISPVEDEILYPHKFILTICGNSFGIASSPSTMYEETARGQ